MKQGMDSVYVKNWKSAINSWEMAFNKEKRSKTKAMAANNIAIGYEITGNLDKALEYAKTSLNLFGQSTIGDYNSIIRLSDYISELNQRKTEMKILKQQLSE
jgi:outer membrane protein assembly factor BamD (BamD/ComL family)